MLYQIHRRPALDYHLHNTYAHTNVTVFHSLPEGTLFQLEEVKKTAKLFLMNKYTHTHNRLMAFGYPYEQVEKIKLKNKLITPFNPQYAVLLLDVPYHWHCLHSMWRRVYATAGSPSVRPSVPLACHTLLLQVCCCGPSRHRDID